jgi:hypothetical protein
VTDGFFPRFDLSGVKRPPKFKSTMGMMLYLVTYVAGKIMRCMLCFGLLAMAMLSAGCGSAELASQRSGLPVRYRNAPYGLTFFLPASWQGYSVSVAQLEDKKYSPAEDRQTLVGYTPMITLRHPQWQPTAPYQDIPILVFTRAQWDELNHGELWPVMFAGGAMDELWHNERFVFVMSSRYNAADEVRGEKEVAEIVERNCAANRIPRLYPR